MLKPGEDGYLEKEMAAQIEIELWREIAKDFTSQYKRNFVAFPLTDFYERMIKLLNDQE